MKNLTWRRLAPAFLALLVFAAALPAAAGGHEEHEKHKVVIKRLHDCPNIQILGTSGEPIHIGRSNRGFLGVEPTSLTPELRRHFGVPGDAGVMIGKVIEDSAAVAAGLAVGDIITRVDGEEILTASGLGRAVRQKSGGDAVEIEYWRGGETYTATATLGEHERCAIDVGEYLHELDFDFEGLDLEGLTEQGLLIGEEALEALRDVDWAETLEGLKDIDWETHLEGLKHIDLEGFEERMEEVQERLRELEESLEREQERLERLERDRQGEEKSGDA